MQDELFSVAGQVTLVSGGSRGIGRAIAEGFAKRGAKVIITGRQFDVLEQTAKEICPVGGTVTPIVCDVAKPADIDQLVKKVVAEFGHIDILLNVAGVNRRMDVEKYTETDYDYIMDINLKGPFLLSVAAAQHMLKRGKGNQINVVSLNTERPLKGVAVYAATKAALAHFTRSMAMEWGPRGIRVNAIAPGFTLTDLARKLWAQPKIQQWGKDNTPLVRLGQPEDMVGAAIFLASEASSWITGQIIFIDGGFSCGYNWPIDFAAQ